MVNNILFIADLLIWLIVAFQYLLYLLNFFQQHEYDYRRFFSWTIKKYFNLGRYYELLLLPFLLFELFHLTDLGLFIVQSLFLGVTITSSLIIRRRSKVVIKRLVITSRAKRIIFVSGFIVLLLIPFITLHFSCKFNDFIFFQCNNTTYFLGLLLVVSQLLVLILGVANIILNPVDTIIREYYIFKAKKKLNVINPIVIGITGSFGKTSTKHILANIIGEKYEVLSIPKSFNTLMGICKVINEDLSTKHQYFIVEMGTYKKGEIKKICKLVKPTIGILTAIGPQHLERFITLENIARAKFELIEALPANGVAIFNNDNLYCRQLADKTRVKTLRYGLEDSKNLDILADNVHIDLLGTKFDVTYLTSPIRSVRLKLLGRQNISNALGAILIAIECGIPLDHAIRSLSVIPPFEHRMQLLQLPNGINVIDNAYSSNPESAKYSLEVLKSIEVLGRKILVTPGFAELGKEQEEEHYKLGKEAAEVSDYVFLIGNDNRIGPIRQGLLDGAFDEKNIFILRSMVDTRDALAKFMQSGDLILIENDLPDVY